MAATRSLTSARPSVRLANRRVAARSVRAVTKRATVSMAAASGFKEMRKGVKEAADETLLSPRFYTTDFDEMEVRSCSPHTVAGCE